VETETTYILYDRKTGAPLASHAYLDLEGGMKPQPLSRVKEDFRRQLKGVAGSGTDVIEVDLPEGASPHEFRIDPKRKRLVPKSTLVLHTRRRRIRGDGKDSTTIEISAMDDRGRVARSAEGKIHVSTTRGRLSARGGDVELARGVAEIELTSAPETVDSVIVAAEDAARLFIPGTIELRFM
jgi:hypothetical protein